MKIKNVYEKLKTQQTVCRMIEDGRSEHAVAFGKIKNHIVGINPCDEKRNGNVLVVGNAETGKSYNHIFGNLILMNTSAVVIDVKGDIHGWIEQSKDFFSNRNIPVYSIDTNNKEAIPKAIADIRKRKGIMLVSGDKIPELIELIIGELFCNDKGEYISFYIDNFSTTGYISGFENFMFISKALNVGVQIVVQRVQQLKMFYEEDYENIIRHCHTILFTGNIVVEDTGCIVCEKLYPEQLKKERENKNGLE